MLIGEIEGCDRTDGEKGHAESSQPGVINSG